MIKQFYLEEFYQAEVNKVKWFHVLECINNDFN